jgi:hypothetical protein
LWRVAFYKNFIEGWDIVSPLPPNSWWVLTCKLSVSTMSIKHVKKASAFSNRWDPRSWSHSRLKFYTVESLNLRPLNLIIYFWIIYRYFWNQCFFKNMYLCKEQKRRPLLFILSLMMKHVLEYCNSFFKLWFQGFQILSLERNYHLCAELHQTKSFIKNRRYWRKKSIYLFMYLGWRSKKYSLSIRE